jgi:Gpi18-like mannosyltransferase
VTSRQKVIGLGLLWLAGVWTIALLSPRIVPWMRGPASWTWDVTRRVTPLTRWDSGWYVNLAEAGYWDPPTRVGQETNHAFFPLYPGLMRLIVRTTGLETSQAGNLVSACAFLAALVLFAEWTRRRYGEGRVLPAILVLLLFPT